MSFPVSPTNAQTVVINGVTYSYNSALNAWNRVTLAVDIGSPGSYANSSFSTANAAASYANSAFAAANTGSGATTIGSYANSAFATANAAGSYANSGLVIANSAASYANSAFASANAANATDATQNTNITAASSYANAAFGVANTALSNDVTTGSYANSAFAAANAATATDATQNTNITNVGTYANSAFARANNSLDTTTGGSITGSIGVTSNVYAGNVIANSGFTSTGGTSKLELTDIGLASIKVAGQTFQFGASGLESSQGIFGGSFGGNRLSLNSETNLISNRGDVVKIQTGTGGTTVNDFVFSNNSLTVPGGITANGFTAGGINVVPTLASSFSTANSAASYANSAFTRANNSISANVGGTITADLVITGNLTVQGNTTYINTETITSEDSLIRLANNNTTGDTVDIGFYGTYNSGGVKYTGLVRQAAADYFLFKGLDTDPTSNVLAAGSLTAANTGTLTANLTSYAVSINGVDVETNQARIFTQANSAFTVANNATAVNETQNTNITTASSYANSSFSTANSAALYANAAFTAANNAVDIFVRTQANSAFDTANVAGSYANSAFAAANAATATDATQNTNITNVGTYANAAFATANTVTSASSYANSAYTQANTATTNAATADAKAVTAGSYANSAFDVANNSTAVNTTQNTNITNASSYANAAFGSANSKVKFTSSATAPTSPNPGDFWYYTTNDVLYESLTDGTSQYWFDIQTPTLSAVASDLAVGAAQYANAAFAQANTALSNDVTTGSYANSAFASANNIAGVNVTQNTNINVASSYANSAFITANTVISASSYANSAFSKANNALTASGNTTTSVQFGSLGIGTAASGTTGEIRATNDITAYYSDDRLKTKFGNIKNALKMVTSLNGFYYEANQTAQDLGYTVRKEVGLSAQEVQKVLPEIVVPAPIDEQYLTIHYEKMIPLLVEAIKELNKKIDKIDKKIDTK